MPEYQVAVQLDRRLDENEIDKLGTNREAPVSSYVMEGEDIVFTRLSSNDATTAPAVAAHQIEKITGVTVQSTQLLP